MLFFIKKYEYYYIKNIIHSNCCKNNNLINMFNLLFKNKEVNFFFILGIYLFNIYINI